MAQKAARKRPPRSHAYRVRLSDEERARYEHQAARAGYPLATWLRLQVAKAGDSVPPQRQLTPEQRALILLLIEVGRVVNNIQQLDRMAAYGDVPGREKWPLLLRSLYDLQEAIVAVRGRRLS